MGSTTLAGSGPGRSPSPQGQRSGGSECNLRAPEQGTARIRAPVAAAARWTRRLKGSGTLKVRQWSKAPRGRRVSVGECIKAKRQGGACWLAFRTAAEIRVTGCGFSSASAVVMLDMLPDAEPRGGTSRPLRLQRRASLATGFRQTLPGSCRRHGRPCQPVSLSHNPPVDRPSGRTAWRIDKSSDRPRHITSLPDVTWPRGRPEPSLQHLTEASACCGPAGSVPWSRESREREAAGTLSKASNSVAQSPSAWLRFGIDRAF
ncbi:uncharacterized protein BDZ99DRAFT_527761 [Mytilinidion resinicola]|uniref:Uncharacterized protein n=1 Tax=Mytilinidion resinicola TaxID=574789 RepID=A0A6A6Y0A9_9PEZI|nr:uncharacterized protein BDZ99DRAFT_527761 [Mytilinidion resinicola]KAF2802089.1 hypothetical protein BDZ99DRAFT_527761 [Mytilinidion resinicola]